MISNTVVVLLRDLLPLFILFAYLFSLDVFCAFGKKWTGIITVSILSSLALFYVSFEMIAESFDGRGYELFSSMMFIAFFLCFVCVTFIQSSALNLLRNVLIAIGIVTLTTLKGTEFLVYFGVFIQQGDDLFSIFIGFLMGISICISFHLLYRFFLQELVRHNRQSIVYLMWFSFLTGQIIQIPERLSQVNLIEIGTPLLNLSQFVQDHSEYGHVLNALFGYESSPSAVFIVVYLCCMTSLILGWFLSSKQWAANPSRTLKEANK